MKKILCFLFTVNALTVFGQLQDVQQLLETARTFQRQSDFENAVLVLDKALEAAPNNTDVIKELAFTWYLRGDNDKAQKEISKLTDREDADEQVFQIAGNIYKSKQDFKEADKVYKKGLKKFPASGVLYSDYGEILYQKDPSSSACIKSWEKGIELDPNFSRNYYNACRYYGTAGNNLWCLVYGEIFVNLESYSTKTIEIKNILFDIYKQWFITGNAAGSNTLFEKQFTSALDKQNREISYGLTPDVLTLIRTRFVLEWFNGKDTPAFRLFEYQRQLLQEGLFEAYNQWLFGSIANPAAYQNWVSTHAEENTAFVNFQRGRIFKIPSGQYYAKP